MTNNTPDYEDNLYFDSQNTKNEQQKDLCITSEQLTEQWKKGELLKGWYYVKDIHNKEILDRYFKETDNFEYLEDWEIAEILAPVPSYQWVINHSFKCFSQRLFEKTLEESAQLKELLKEMRQQITEQVFGSPKLQLFEGTFDNKLLAKIDEALK